ncbi:MAG: S-methyl-5'-thioadenosine phosphorylase [Planctomycetota bacterium]
MTGRRARVGVIGGSGFYDMRGVEVLEEVEVATPWGRPSDAVVLACLEGEVVAFLSRHGRGHRLLPGEVNSRANIAALKKLGVEQLIAFSAVGSLREELRPLDFVVPSQVIDRTRGRPGSFFGGGVVGHVAFADPFCERLADLLRQKIGVLDLPGQHHGDTLVCIEGPLFSTRAESRLYRSWGAGLINMSALPEAKLAREAELCYALVCMVTDYDCWREGESDVDIQTVLEYLRRNAENARRLVAAVAGPVAASNRTCGCKDAARFAIITEGGARNPETVARLHEILPTRFP